MSFPLALTPAIKETNPMAKADPNSTTNAPISDATSRRNFLTSTAGIAAGATAIATVPALALPADPIYSAIDAHAESVRTVWTLHARLLRMIGGDMAVAEDLCRSPETRAVQAALLAECAAATALIETAPTTRAGLRALADHLRDDRYRSALWFIERTVRTDGGFSYDSRGNIDWLIAKRAAELGIAG
jgi:hypothetical protein